MFVIENISGCRYRLFILTNRLLSKQANLKKKTRLNCHGILTAESRANGYTSLLSLTADRIFHIQCYNVKSTADIPTDKYNLAVVVCS